MDFWTLSLPEASGVWLGLATQALIRNAPFALLGARIIVTAWVIFLIRHMGGETIGTDQRTGTGTGPALRYAGTALLVLLFFWPETLPFGASNRCQSDATRVGSYPASQEPGAAIVSAWDTGLVPPQMQGPVLVPCGLKIVLGSWQSFWLALARTLNNQTHRTFANLLPMHWLLGSDTGLTAPIVAATGDWVHNCYVPALTHTLEGEEARTSEDLSPWAPGAMQQALAVIEVVPGTQQGLTFIGPPGVQTMGCNAYLFAIETLVQGRLYETTTPNGTPLAEVFQKELGLDTIAQAQFILMQEIRRAVGSFVPPPSLLGQYLGLRGLKVGLDAGTGAVGGAFSGRAGGMGALIGSLLGAARGVSGELENLLQGLTWILRIALLVTWFLPYILGQILFVSLTVFPILLLLSLMWRWTHVVLGSYIMLLGFLTSAPVWWAFADQFSKAVAGSSPAVGLPGNTAIFSTLTQSTWIATIGALGIIVIGPTLSALLLGAGAYSAYRGVAWLVHRGGF